jgi:hypothetical protein
MTGGRLLPEALPPLSHRAPPVRDATHHPRGAVVGIRINQPTRSFTAQ